jgi:Na+-driven multidrug efflux pump
MQAVRRQLDQLFLVHAALAVVSGALCFLTPHSLLSPLLGDANNSHLAHEFIRLYGASPSLALALAGRSPPG